MRSLRIAILGLISTVLIVISSCASASTSVSSIQNPKYRLDSYKSVVISAPHQNLEIRQKAETIFAKEFAKLGMDVQLGIEITPPDQEFADGEIGRIYEDEGILGVFTIQLTGTDETEMDQQQTKSNSQNQYTGNDQSQYTGYVTQTSGNTISISRKKFAVTLWNTDNTETVWVSSAITTANAYAGANSFLKSLARETAKTFMHDMENEAP